MVSYWVKTPQWLKKFFPRQMVWDMPATTATPTVYITFDDGPHPTITPYVLKQLAAHNARATFFCVGHNVTKYPQVYQTVLAAGHTTGNHTYNHLNGWKTANSTYLKNIRKASRLIRSNAFRPPYGRIRLSQMRKMSHHNPSWRVYMWDILSADFDRNITPAECLDNVLRHITPGSIIVFHDSEKAWDRMSFALPRVLEYCTHHGWTMEALPA